MKKIICVIIFIFFANYSQAAALPADYSSKDGTLKVKKGIIYDENIKRGYIKDNKINIYLGKKIVIRFKGDIKKLRFNGLFPKDDNNFYYDSLDITKDLESPPGYIDLGNKVNYKCDGSYEKQSCKELGICKNNKETFDVPYFYCQTNKINYLSQYEFNAATGFYFGTGGDYGKHWNKMYSRKQASVNIFFIGDIDHQSISSDPSYDKDHKKAKKITSKKYLDSILAKKEIKTKVKKWDKFVKDAEIIILK